MTIDEAIRHCEEVAEENEAKAQKIGVQFLGTIKYREATECRECAADHRQLAEWLRELQEAKRLLKLAVENMNDGGCTRSCSTCKYGREGCKYTEGYEWIHTEEAEKLLKEEK